MQNRITREELIALVAEATKGEGLAGEAVAEWAENELADPTGLNVSAHESEAWAAYCASKGNCGYNEFDAPLIEAYAKAEDAIRALGGRKLGFPYGGLDTSAEEAAEELRAEFGYMLFECHN